MPVSLNQSGVFTSENVKAGVPKYTCIRRQHVCSAILERWQESMLTCSDDGLSSAVDIQLAEDVAGMFLHCAD